MATKVVMEALSPTMEEGRLVKWNKNEGDQIKTGDVLAEVETDKAVMELVARGDGVLRKRLGNEGDSSPVGTLLAVIANPDENIDSIVGSAAPAAASASTSTQSGQVAASSQASPPPASATGAPPPPNQAVADTKESTVKSPVRPAPPPRPSSPPAPKGNGAGRPGAPSAGGRQRSSPLARRLATEKGIQLGGIQGTGPGG